MGRNDHPFKAVAMALLCALMPAQVSGLHAQTITNTANASWSTPGQNFTSSSNSVSFNVTIPQVTMQTFVDTPGATGSLAFSPSQCGNSALQVPNSSGNSSRFNSLAAATSLRGGDTFFFQLTAPIANLDPGAIDVLNTEITTTSGDRETITVYETAVDSGVFVGAMPTTEVPPDPVPHDCKLSVASGDSITIQSYIPGRSAPLSTGLLDVLADPYGLVFDSEDGSPVDNVKVTLIDVATGQAARVFAPDGITPWPSTVFTGQPVTDSAGNIYPMPTGEYRFPLAYVGQYKLAITPPEPYTAPSRVSTSQLGGILRPDGKPVVIIPASFGNSLALTSPEPVRVDIPVDRPPIAVSVSKTTSRTTAQPGDAVFYTVVVQNPDKLRGKHNVVLTDVAAQSLRLRRSSIRLDGVPRPDAVTYTPDGGQLIVQMGDFAPGARHVVTYAMSVKPNAAPGQALNKAMATDSRGLTGYGSAVIQIEEDGLTGRMTILGRITAGGCGKDAPHYGIPGVQMLMEDGSFAITDRDGRYHFNGVTPGDHVVQAVAMTLPEGGKLLNCGRSTRNAGSAISRFVSGQGGSLAVADFYASLPETAEAALEAGAKAEAAKNAKPKPVSKDTTAEKAPDGTKKPIELNDKGDINDAQVMDDRRAAGAETDWLRLGDGPTDFLFPAMDHNPRSPAIRVVIRHRVGEKVALMVDGKAVDPIAMDGTKVSFLRTWAVSVWRGIPLSGDVTHLTAEVTAADGSVVAKLARDVHFAQTAASAVLIPEKSRLVADGRTRPVIALKMLDRDGRPLHDGVAGEFGLNAPYESAASIDAMQLRSLVGQGRNAPRWAVKGDEGIALIELAPTMVSGALQLDFNFIDGKQRRHQTINNWIVPGDLKWTLVGLAQGSVGAKTVADAMERTGRFDSDLGTRARTAFYAKGRVLGKFLLTIAYDSAKQRADQRLLGAIDPKSYYTVFADGSDRRFDAASRHKLYVRIESRAFTALFGDFEASFNQTQLLRYQRVATGIKAEARVGGFHAQAFGAKISSSHRREEIQGGGISGPYRLGSKAIIANSETVALQVRDRFRSEVIVSNQVLTRFVDYDVDLLAGTITFKSPIFSRDAAQNPQFIIVDYEVDPLKAVSGKINAGVRADWTSKNGKVRVGTTLVTNQDEGVRTNMGGIDVRAKLNKDTEVRAEAGLSRADGKTSNAWLIEVEHHDNKLDILAYARSADQKYGIGQMNGAEQGRRKYGLDARYRFNEVFAVSTSAWHDTSLTSAAKRDALSVQAEYHQAKTDMRVGVSTIRDHAIDGTSLTSTVLEGGVTKRMLGGKLQVEASTSVALGGATESLDLPARHQLNVQYALTRKAKLTASYEIAKGTGINARTARAGIELQPWQGGRITAGMGQQAIDEYGKRSFAAFGLNQSLEVSKHLTLDATLDANKVLGGIDATKINNPDHPVASGGHFGESGSLTENFTAITLGANYRAGRWSSTLRGEMRNGQFAKRRGFTFGAIRQLGEGQMVGSGMAWTRARGNDGSLTQVFDASIAAAYRPATSPFSFLAKVEYRSDTVVGATNGVAGIGGATGTTALTVNGNARSRRLIGSFSGNWSPRGRDGDEFVQKTEIGWFAAVRQNFDSYQGFDLKDTTLIGGIDAHIGLGEHFEIGGQATVRTNITDHVTSYAIGPTIGFVPAKDVLLTVGYNLSGFRDRDFAAARTTDRGVFASLKMKFDSSTFGFLGLGR